MSKRIVGLPTLADDGETIMFPSAADYQQHHKRYIRHGALLVSTDPIDVGARRKLRLVIGDDEEVCEIVASVLYREAGLVGFVIEGFAYERAKLFLVASADQRSR